MGRQMRSVKLAALAAVGALALAGCATGSPQVAAYVNGNPIPQSQVDAVAKVLTDTSSDPADTAGDAAALVVQVMIQSEVAPVAAKNANITISETQRDQALASNATLTALAKNPVTADFINDYAETQLLVSTDAGKTAFNDAFVNTTVELNPRLGVWDDTQHAIVDGSTGSISEVAPIRQE